jgi:iron complex outermembrane receptor protein
MNNKIRYGLARTGAAVLLCMYAAVQAHAQAQTDKVALLDTETSLPIEGATYNYASQSGVSDSEGVVEIAYRPDAILIISHVGYGRWQLSPGAVREAIASGVIYRRQNALDMQPVTIIALRRAHGEVKSIKLDQEDLLSHDAGAILNRTPLFNSIRKSGGYGFDPVMRGFKYEQLNVVINGAQTALAACPNRMDPPASQIAPNMMQQIEVYKGPHSMRYGTSFGGTINFVTAPAVFSGQPEAYGRLSGIYEGNGNLFRSEGMVGYRTEKIDAGVYSSWAMGNDYQDGDGQLVAAGFKRGSIGANTSLKLKPDQVLRMSVTRNFAREVDFPALPMDLRSDDTWLLNAQHEAMLDRTRLKSWHTTLYGTFVDHFMDNRLKMLDPRMVNAETEARTVAYGGRTEGTWRSGYGTLYAGVDLRIEGADGERAREFLMGPNAGKTVLDNVWQQGRITRSGMFAEYHLQTESLFWSFSGRLEINRAATGEAQPEFSNVYDDSDALQLNPGISVGGLKNFGQRFSLALWLGRAQRSGSLIERFINYFPVGLDPYEMVGNPAINPEINNQVDLQLAFYAGGAEFSVDVFAAYLQDYISSDIDSTLTPRMPTSPGVRRHINIPEAFKGGFEFAWKQRLAAGLNHRLAMAYTYGQDLWRNQALPEIAPMDIRYSLYGNYLKDRLTPEITYRHVLRQSRVSEEFGETETPSFNVVDVRVSYRITETIKCSGGIKNLFDVAYYEHLSRSVRGPSQRAIYQPGRNAFISVTIDFQ